MRLQSNQSSCGPASLYNGACALGKKLSMVECEKACNNTATDGTTVRKLMNAARTLGFAVHSEVKESKDTIAVTFVEYHLRRGRIAVIAADADSHWIVIVGLLGDRFLVADSEDNELVLSYSDGELLQRWRVPEVKRGCYYALILQ